MWENIFKLENIILVNIIALTLSLIGASTLKMWHHNNKLWWKEAAFVFQWLFTELGYLLYKMNDN